jgi:hypothetical protein
MNEEFKYPETMSYQDRLAFEKYLEEKNRPLSTKIWDGVVNVFSYIIGGILMIFYSIMGLGSCILNLLITAFCFWLGWMVITGIWNWIF